MNAQFSFKLLELTQEFIPDPEKAKTFVHQLQATVDHRMNQRLEPLATKADLQKEISSLRLEVLDQKGDLLKTIYMVGLVQFLGIVASVLAIIAFMG